MDDLLSKRLVPDELSAVVEPLTPPFSLRAQGGGTAPRDARAVFTAIVYVLTSGCAWRLWWVIAEKQPGLRTDFRPAVYGV